MKIYCRMNGRLTICDRNKSVGRLFITGINNCIFIKQAVRISATSAGVTAQIKYLVSVNVNFLNPVPD